MPGTASLIELYDDDRDGRTFTLTRRPPGQPKGAPVPIDLVAEGWTGWKAQWRPRQKSEEFVELEVDDADAADGVIVVTFTSEMVRDISALGSKGVWDLQAHQTPGEPHTFLAGDTTWRLGVTRP